MDDFISRQAAIDLVSNHTFYADYDNMDELSLIDGLKELPFVSTEKTGRWIKKKSMIYCSECCDGFDVFTLNDPFKYCPNCGTKMEVE